jgi:hypothetical protein
LRSSWLYLSYSLLLMTRFTSKPAKRHPTHLRDEECLVYEQISRDCRSSGPGGTSSGRERRWCDLHRPASLRMPSMILEICRWTTSIVWERHKGKMWKIIVRLDDGCPKSVMVLHIYKEGRSTHAETSKHGKSIFRNLNLSCSQLGLAQVGLIRRGQT